MCGIVELIPTQVVVANSGNTYLQPPETVVDVSNFREGAVFLEVHEVSRPSREQVSIFLSTSWINRTEQFYVLTCMKTYPSGPPDPTQPEKIYAYVGGPGGSSDTPGFGRYVRMAVNATTSAWSLTMRIVLVLKP